MIAASSATKTLNFLGAESFDIAAKINVRGREE
jgi:hypothetical protein